MFDFVLTSLDFGNFDPPRFPEIQSREPPIGMIGDHDSQVVEETFAQALDSFMGDTQGSAMLLCIRISARFSRFCYL